MIPRVIIQLDDGTNTWVAAVPVNWWAEGQEEKGVIAAAGEAVGHFIANVVQDAPAVREHLREAHDRLA